MKKILFIILILIIPLNIKAYECDYFTVDIPDEYKLKTEENGAYYWTTNDEDNFPEITIVISNNNGLILQDIEKFSEEDMDEYKKTLISNLNSGMEKYNIEVSIEDYKKEKINDTYSISYTTIWPKNDIYAYDIYQNNYVFTNVTYIASVTYITKEKDQNKDGFYSIVNSFKLKGENFTTGLSIRERNILIITLSILAAVTVLIIKAIKKNK